MKTTFVPKTFALKQGRSKQDYINAVTARGGKALYSGKTITDSNGNVMRQPGFYVS